MRRGLRPVLIAAALMLLSACKEEVAQNTAPQDMTLETLGHYCQMNLLEHEFFAFKNEAEGNAFAVVYRRKNGGYGMIADA